MNMINEHIQEQILQCIDNSNSSVVVATSYASIENQRKLWTALNKAPYFSQKSHEELFKETISHIYYSNLGKADKTIQELNIITIKIIISAIKELEIERKHGKTLSNINDLVPSSNKKVHWNMNENMNMNENPNNDNRAIQLNQENPGVVDILYQKLERIEHQISQLRAEISALSPPTPTTTPTTNGDVDVDVGK